MQNYKIGHYSFSLENPQQNHHAITAEIFYPSLIGGKQSKIVDEKFPFIIFAHGYLQNYNNYEYIQKHLVLNGYVFIFITTQQGLIINIDEYAKDIVYLYNSLTNLNNNHMISEHLTDKSALMGHSTGGGAIYLAQASLSHNTTLISLAALGKPYFPIMGSSPVDNATDVTASSLIISGDKDCITSKIIHQKALYDNIKKKKILLTIKNADHCGFTHSFKCPFTEAILCGFLQGKTIQEKKQKELTLQFILPWLDYYLKEKSDSLSSFKNVIQSDFIKYETDLIL